MHLIGKYILMIMMFSGFLFFYSDGIQKTGNKDEQGVKNEVNNIVAPCGNECKDLKKHDVDNPDYVPVNCGDCTNGKVDYWHQDIVGDRECYFGKNIKKQN